jgi:hypothetical protein
MKVTPAVITRVELAAPRGAPVDFSLLVNGRPSLVQDIREYTHYLEVEFDYKSTLGQGLLIGKAAKHFLSYCVLEPVYDQPNHCMSYTRLHERVDWGVREGGYAGFNPVTIEIAFFVKIIFQYRFGIKFVVW